MFTPTPRRQALGPLLAGLLLLPSAAPTAGFHSDADGQVDNAFQRPDLKVRLSPFIYGSDGRGGILWSSANGAILNSAENLRLGLVRTDAEGNVDSGFVVGPVFSSTTGAVTGPNGTVYLAASEARDLAPNGYPFTRIYRIHPDGTLDRSFRSPGFDSAGRFMALQPDGRLLVTSGGLNYQRIGGLNGLQRLNVDGTLDATFQPTVFDDANSIFCDPVVDPQGRIVVAGMFRTVNGSDRQGVARLQPDGTLDETFVPRGYTVSSPIIRGLSVQSDGRIILGGSPMLVEGLAGRQILFRLNQDGTVDPSFPAVASGFQGNNRVRWIQTLPDGRLVVGGSGVFRLLADGRVDTTFNPPAADSSGLVTRIVPLTQDRILIGPAFTPAGGTAGTGFLVLNDDGSPDPAFHWPLFQEDAVRNLQALALPDGRLLVWGMFDTWGNRRVAPLVRLLPDGTLDPSFDLRATNGLPEWNTDPASGTNYMAIRNLQRLGDGRLYAFLDTGTSAYPFTDVTELKRLLPDGSVDPTFQWPQFTSETFAFSSPTLALWNDRLILAYDTDPQVLLEGTSILQRLLLDGSPDPTFSGLTNQLGSFTRDASGNLAALVLSGFKILHVADDGAMLASHGETPAFDQTAPYTFGLLRLLPSGQIDPAFQTDTLSGSPGYVSYPEVRDPKSGESTQVIALYPPASPILAAHLLPDGAALMSALFPSPSPGLVRYLADGRRDPSFQPGIELLHANGQFLPPRVQSIAVDDRGRIWITGDFTRVGGLPRIGIARLLADGTVDPSFTAGVEYYPWTSDTSNLVPSPDGSLYLVGTFRRPGELWPSAITRLAPPPPYPAAVVSLDVTGHLRVRLQTAPGLYEWQRTPALGVHPWLSVLRTNLSDGIFEFTDPTPATDAGGFFRLVPQR